MEQHKPSKTIKTEHGDIVLTKDGDAVVIKQKSKILFVPIKNIKEYKQALTELLKM